jgi:hypothetical protein
LAFVFVRASVEVGEERPWILLYLCFVAAPVAEVLGWIPSRLSWPLRLGIGALVLAAGAGLLVPCVSLADGSYADPRAFRPVLPVVFCAERLHLRDIEAAPGRVCGTTRRGDAEKGGRSREVMQDRRS